MSISYSHPYIQTNIYDDSEVTVTSTSTENPILYQPYFSERGVSGVVEEFTDLSTFISQKGTPNFKKYGQTQYNIVNWLNNAGRVFAVRLTPEDATYANIALNVKTKPSTKEVEDVAEDGSYTTKIINTVDIKLETVKFSSLVDTSSSSLEVLINEVDGATDDEGYTSHILFILSCKGKGSYGNNLTIRITQNSGYNKTYDFACYNLTVMETKSNGTIKNTQGPLGFSFYPEALSMAGSSLTMKQIIENYFDTINCYFNEEGYDTLVDTIMSITDNAYDITGAIDLLFGDDNITVDATEASSLFSYNGVYLEDGNDGTYGSRYTDPSFATDRDELLISAYSGELNPEIFDKKRFPIDVLLDYNSSEVVKSSIYDFVQQRGDCICILDTGDIATPSGTVAWKQSNLNIDGDTTSYLGSIWSQMLTLFDKYTSTDITVSPTYFLANKIPYNDNNYGIQYPFVGPNRGIITGYKSINWTPSEEQKELLYDNRINYIEKNYRNTRFMSQLTTQSKTTALSDLNHVRAMLKIIRSVEELMEGYLFEFANDDTLTRINSALENTLSNWVTNGTCKTCSGTCSQTAIEAENKTAHVTINIVFTDVIEKIIIDINITR